MSWIHFVWSISFGSTFFFWEEFWINLVLHTELFWFISEVKHLLSPKHSFQVWCISKVFNLIADALAKYYVRCRDSYIWLEDFPIYLCCYLWDLYFLMINEIFFKKKLDYIGCKIKYLNYYGKTYGTFSSQSSISYYKRKIVILKLC